MDRYERKLALEKQVSNFSDELKKKAKGFSVLGKDILIIGGIITAGYVLTRLLDEDEPEPKQSKSDSFIFATLKGVATSMALAMAKQKLSEYLKTLKQPEND